MGGRRHHQWRLLWRQDVPAQRHHEPRTCRGRNRFGHAHPLHALHHRPKHCRRPFGLSGRGLHRRCRRCQCHLGAWICRSCVRCFQHPLGPFPRPRCRAGHDCAQGARRPCPLCRSAPRRIDCRGVPTRCRCFSRRPRMGRCRSRLHRFHAGDGLGCQCGDRPRIG